MAATLTRRPISSKPTQAVHLQETSRASFAPLADGENRVDEERGIIRGVKLVGLKSRNVGRTIGLDPRVFGDAVHKPYEYSKRALESALAKYEGATCRIDHRLTEVDRSGQRIPLKTDRPTLSVFGRHVNARVREDGIYADLEYIKSHPAASFVVEVAKRMPEQLALSQDAAGKPELINGRAVITEIFNVSSVDIVGDQAGTTNGLFESLSEATMPKQLTIKQIVETAPKNTAGLAILVESMGEMMGDAPIGDMPVEVGEASSAEVQVSDALKALVVAVFDDEKLSTDEKLGKIKAIFNMADTMSGKAKTSAEGETKVSETNAKTGNVDPNYKALLETVNDLKKTATELKAERDDLKATDAVRTLLESSDREATQIRINALKGLSSEDDRKALIETWPRKANVLETSSLASRRPMTSAPLMETAAPAAANVDDFVRRVKGR